ncbi:MAG: hypothetical protein Q8N98_03760, partial [bacterium]|nr:hypothetical protein [bacterium]
TSEQLRGRVYGILTGLGGGLSMLPVLAVGILADLFGVGKVIAAIGIIVLGYGIWKISNAKVQMSKFKTMTNDKIPISKSII